LFTFLRCGCHLRFALEEAKNVRQDIQDGPTPSVIMGLAMANYDEKNNTWLPKRQLHLPRPDRSLLPPSLFTKPIIAGNEPGSQDVDVTCWGVALTGLMDFQVIKLGWEGWYGQNIGVTAEIFDTWPATVPFHYAYVAKATTCMERPYIMDQRSSISNLEFSAATATGFGVSSIFKIVRTEQ